MAKISILDDSAEYYHNSGVTFNNEGKFVEAISSFHLALERDKKRGIKRKSYTAATYSEIAFSFFSLGIYEEALRYYIKLLSLEDRSEEAHIGLIRCNLKLNRFGSATFFLSRAFDMEIFSSESDLSEFDEIFANQSSQEPKPPITLKDKKDYSKQLSLARNMTVSGNYSTARTLLEVIPEDAYENTEKWELMGSIAIFEKNYEDALALSKYTLEEVDGDSLTARIIKVLALDGLNDKKGAFSAADEIPKSGVYSKYDDCEKIANAMSKIGYDALAEKYYENCCQLKPYRIITSVYLAIVKHNLGKKGEVKEIMRTLRTLYPQDTVVKYYSRVLSDDSVGTLPVDYFLPLEEEKRRYKIIDERFTELSTVENAEEYIRQNPEFKEYVEWLLCYGDEDIAVKVGKFLVQSEEWREFFEDRFLDPSLSTTVKMEYLYDYLRVSKNRKVACYLGYNYICETISPPRCEDNLSMQDAYYKAYTVSLAISVDFKSRLNKVYKEVVKRLNSAEFSDKILVIEMSAILAFLAKTNDFFASLNATCETFGANYQTVCSYMTLLGYDIPSIEDERNIARAFEEFVRKTENIIVEFKEDDNGD